MDKFFLIPAELSEKRRWVTWRYVQRCGKTTKKPLQSITTPSAWLSLAEAYDYVACGKANGIGFVLGEGLVGIDLDDCFDPDGTLHEIGQDAIGLGSYVERSPSGRGLRVLIWARISKSRNIAARGNIPRHEIYDGREGSARYLTITGDRVGDASGIRQGAEAQTALDAFYAKWFSEEAGLATERHLVTDDLKPLEDDELLRVMFGAKDGVKWRRLFEGDHSTYPSPSEADFALIRKLRFYSRADPAQMDRLFRRSGLMRRKWDERRANGSYGARTITKALMAGGRLYRRGAAQYKPGAPGGQFGKVHVSVLPILARLPKTDILTYLGAAVHANGEDGSCDQSAARIAALFGISRERAQTSIGNLRNVNLLSAEGRPGRTSILHLVAFGGVSNFDTPRSRRAKSSPKLPDSGRPRRLGRRTEPVSDLDTPPVSNFDTQTDKEQNMGTGEGEASASEDEEPRSEEPLVAFPKPSIPLSKSARLLRDDMLRGPVGQFFLQNHPTQTALGL